jgi:hypothetical protein
VTTKNIFLDIASKIDFDEKAKSLINLWEDEPKSIQILEVLDKSIYFSWTGSLGIQCLQTAYECALKREGVSHDYNANLALWREQLT